MVLQCDTDSGHKIKANKAIDKICNTQNKSKYDSNITLNL